MIRCLASSIGEIHLAFVRWIDALAKPGLCLLKGATK